MSAETFNPRTGELPGYWETVKHFGKKAIRWTLGIQEPSAYSTAKPRTEQSHLLVSEWQTSPTALTQGQQRAARTSRVEAPTAPDLSHLMGAETLPPTPVINAVGGEIAPPATYDKDNHSAFEGATKTDANAAKTVDRSVGPPGGVIE